MKFSLSWLEEHIDFVPNVDIDTIVNSLTDLGLEVESLDKYAENFKDFIIAEIINVKKHPNADRLSICDVNIGDKSIEVVCGAKNVKNKLKVVFAPIGSMIPSTGLVLKKKEIRGFTGHGMLCSAEELGLEGKSDGIMELPANAEVGKLLSNFNDYDDVIFEIGLTPNRGDCASVLGIARELSAMGLGQVKEKKKEIIKKSFRSPINWKLDLSDKDRKACTYVTGRYFKGLKNRESPEWLKKRLISIGLRPISCLVDLTNFITFDLGRPLHVFDAKKVKGDLTVRMAKENENIKALDGKHYNLKDNILIIADEESIVSIAGVMGGEESSCDFNTTEVFLESAMFDPLYVSNSGRKLNILSDARYRFERGVDPLYVDDGLNIMTNLVLSLCGGEVSEVVKSGTLKVKKNLINYNPDKVKKLSGLSVSKLKQKNILLKLGFECVVTDKSFKVVVPSWRNDINSEIDIVEEIIRLNGYNNLEELELPYYNNKKSVLSSYEVRNRIIRNSLIKRGLYESITFSFLAEKDVKIFSDRDVFLKLDNPISEDLSVMRTSLLPNLVNNFNNNNNKGLKNIGLFEVGAIYLGENKEDQYNAVAGVRAGPAGIRHWSESQRDVDVFDCKKDIYSILKVLRINSDSITINRNVPKWYHPGRSGSINLGKSLLGYFGELHPNLTNDYGMRMVAFEFFTDNLPESKKEKVKKLYKKYNLMPIKRDFSFFIDSDTLAINIESTVRNTLKNNTLVELIEVNLFDLYEDKSSDKKSLALEVNMQPIEHTLDEEELKSISELLIEKIKEKNNAILKD